MSFRENGKNGARRLWVQNPIAKFLRMAATIMAEIRDSAYITLTMHKHHYKALITWTGNTGSGTSHYKAYERNHTVSVGGKVDILSSSDPQFRGDPARYNPEELFLASVSSCHMLWYLHLCAEAGVVVTGYTDAATGIMQETDNGGGHFTEMTLYPMVTVEEKSMLGKATALHHEANQRCFIANSCNFPIYHQPTSKV